MCSRLIFFVEELSMEMFLRAVLPKLLPRNAHYDIYAFQGKPDLLKKLPDRLRGLGRALAPGSRIIVLTDQDNDDCQQLKRKLNQTALRAGLRVGGRNVTTWQVINRIVVRELESWYFGDWDAVRSAFPRVSANVPRQQPYRDPDNIAGGTWEALERLLKRGGYYRTGIAKVELARKIGSQFDPNRCTSPSFRCFRETVLSALASEH